MTLEGLWKTFCNSWTMLYDINSIDKVLNLQSMCFKIKQLIFQIEISNVHLFLKCPLHFKVINESMFKKVKSLEQQHLIYYHIKTPSSVTKVIDIFIFQRINSDVIMNCSRRQKLNKHNYQTKGHEMPKYFCFIECYS